MVKKRKGQVTIFIILAVLIIGAVIAFFMLRSSNVSSIPKEMQPVYNYYLSCLEQNAQQGISLLGEQAGYIYVDKLDFSPASSYKPFSSQLNFFGQPVPYWMYVSGNNVLKIQKPTLTSMEKELKTYSENNVGNCDFSEFYAQGFNIEMSEATTQVQINENSVDVLVKSPITIQFENQSVTLSEHEFSIQSKLGKFYSLASNVYDYEMQNSFLEAYSLDVMRLYAPVSGVELTCSPKVFSKEQITKNLTEALAANIGALKLRGNYYDMANEENKYFVTDIGQSVSENVNFIYSPNWSTKIEISGDTVAKPVGNQQGLAMLGFCYVPYKFVYDIDFPVLVQFYDENEIFQFPIAVVIKQNQPREAIESSSNGDEIKSPVCNYPNQDVSIYTYDSLSEPVKAKLSFKCLNSECDVGETTIQGSDAVFKGVVPQCVNGFIVASAEGYVDGKYQMSTNEEETANVILRKKYNLSLDLGKVDSAIVNFYSEDYSASAYYPDTKNIELVEGDYNVSVYAYTNSTLKIPASTEKKCVQVPAAGLGGLFGAQDEKCYDITLPETDVGFALVGGGNNREYLTEGQLKESKELNINVPLLSKPTSLQGLQDNYAEVEDSRVYLSLE